MKRSSEMSVVLSTDAEPNLQSGADGGEDGRSAVPPDPPRVWRPCRDRGPGLRERDRRIPPRDQTVPARPTDLLRDPYQGGPRHHRQQRRDHDDPDWLDADVHTERYGEHRQRP